MTTGSNPSPAEATVGLALRIATAPIGQQRQNWKHPHRHDLVAAVKLVLVILLFLIAAAIAVPGWSYLSSYEDTDDAQIDGHIIPVSSRINGTIAHVYVIDTQTVRKGQLLADIAPADYVVAVEGTRAKLAQTKAQVESANADYQTALSKVSQDEATRAKAEYDVPRLAILAAKGAARREDYQESLRIAKVARATVDADRASANAALKNIDSREAAVEEAQADLDQASLNYGYTKITAPMSGVIGKKDVEPGQRVQPGQSLWRWCRSTTSGSPRTSRRTQLRRMRPGQSVDIRVDALTGRSQGLRRWFGVSVRRTLQPAASRERDR